MTVVVVNREMSGKTMQKLDAVTANKVKGQIIVPNLTLAVAELVFNSLDARSTSIEIRIDIMRWSIQVNDDGDGIIPEDLKFCGVPNFTSKSDSLTTYGFRGQSLSALSSFSYLEILSCSKHDPSRTLRSLVHLGQSQPGLSFGSKTNSGTTVLCRNLFFNRPVVRKSFQNRAGISEIDKLTSATRTISVLHPTVAFELYSGSSSLLFSTQRSTSVRQRFAELFSGSQVASAMYEVAAPLGCIENGHEIRALLCPPMVLPMRSKSAQLVFINGRPCTRGPIHKLVARLYKNFTGDVKQSRAATSIIGLLQKKKRKIGEKESEDFNSIGTSFHPAFLVIIRFGIFDCSFSSSSDSAGCFAVDFTNLEVVLKKLENLCQKVFHQAIASPEEPLSEHRDVMRKSAPTDTGDEHAFCKTNLRPATIESGGVRVLARAELAQDAYASSFFENPTGQTAFNGCEVTIVKTNTNISVSLSESANVDAGTKHCIDLNEIQEDPPATSAIGTEVVSAEEMAVLESAIFTAGIAHTRAMAVRQAAASARSGSSFGMRSPMAGVRGQFSSDRLVHGPRVISFGSQTPTSQRSGQIHPDSFGPRTYDIHAERWLPSKSPVSKDVLYSKDADHEFYESGQPNVSQTFNGFGDWESPVFGDAMTYRILQAENASSRRCTTITRNALSKAVVIGQSHKKFVVCCCPCNHDVGEDDLLLLIDQHAADERIRLEAMENAFHLDRSTKSDDHHKDSIFEGLHEIKMFRVGRNGREVWETARVSLVPPAALDGLDPNQLQQLNHFHQALLAWGFEVQHFPSQSPSGTRVLLSQAPRIMGQGPLQTLGVNHLLDYLRELSSSAGARFPVPQAVHRILSSKACRGSIMFGDAMSPIQCVGLVRSLAQCRLPFQCAHGRPTVLPLADLSRLRPNFAVGFPQPRLSRIRALLDGDSSKSQMGKKDSKPDSIVPT